MHHTNGCASTPGRVSWRLGYGLRHRPPNVKSFHLRPRAFFCLLACAAAGPASAATPPATCQAELQHLSRGGVADDALRACTPLFKESACQAAWSELLDRPRASPGYGRGAAIARLAEACVKAYCRFPGMGRQQLCTGKTPPPLTAEFFDAWSSFETEVLRREHVPPATSGRLAHALELWTGFVPRPGARNVLQAVTRADVPGVVALTLWSAHGEPLGAWVTDVVPDEVTLKSLQSAVPPPTGEPPPSTPCVRLEASGALPAATSEVLLRVLRAVCPTEMVTVHGV
jgi:hypothetical protein